jgi:Meiotically Up-regulated Gene 113 (MUG113) protein
VIEEQQRQSCPRPSWDCQCGRGHRNNIYLIGAAGLSAVKIGSARNPQLRLQQLQVGSPVPLAILWTYPFLQSSGEEKEGMSLEKALHHRFAGRRLHGEWFDLSPDPVAATRTAIMDLVTSELPDREIEKDFTREDVARLFAEMQVEQIFTSDLMRHLRKLGGFYMKLNDYQLQRHLTRHLGPTCTLTIGKVRARGYRVHQTW